MDRWVGLQVGGWSRTMTGVLGTKGWVGELVVGGVHRWVGV